MTPLNTYNYRGWVAGSGGVVGNVIAVQSDNVVEGLGSNPPHVFFNLLFTLFLKNNLS